MVRLFEIGSEGVLACCSVDNHFFCLGLLLHVWNIAPWTYSNGDQRATLTEPKSSWWKQFKYLGDFWLAIGEHICPYDYLPRQLNQACEAASTWQCNRREWHQTLLARSPWRPISICWSCIKRLSHRLNGRTSAKSGPILKDNVRINFLWLVLHLFQSLPTAALLAVRTILCPTTTARNSCRGWYISNLTSLPIANAVSM